MATALEALDKEEDPEDAPKPRIYTLESLTAGEVLGLLQQEFPHITFAAAADPHAGHGGG